MELNDTERLKQYERYVEEPQKDSSVQSLWFDIGILTGKTANVIRKCYTPNRCMYLALIAFVTALAIGIFQSRNISYSLYRIQQNGLYGFIDSTGCVMIEPQYKYVSAYSDEGLSLVISDVRPLAEDNRFSEIRYGVIDKMNRFVMDTTLLFCIYDPEGKLIRDFQQLNFCSDFLSFLMPRNGRIAFQKRANNTVSDFESYGLMNLSGEQITDCKYVTPNSDYINLFSNSYSQLSYWVVAPKEIKSNKNAPLSLINGDGRPIWSSVKNLSTYVSDNKERWIQIPMTNILMGDSVVQSKGSYHKRFLRVRSPQNMWVLIDKNGQLLQTLVGMNDSCVLIRSSNTTNMVRLNDTISIYDNDMNYVGISSYSGESTKINFPSEGYMAVKDNWDGKYGWSFIDSTLTRRCINVYDNVGSFHEGLAAVCIKKKWGAIDKNFRVVIPFKFDYVKSFNHGLAYFANQSEGNYQEGYIDKMGNIVWQTTKSK